MTEEEGQKSSWKKQVDRYQACSNLINVYAKYSAYIFIINKENFHSFYTFLKIIKT